MALEKATITNLNTNDRLPVMFNPEEYSLEVGNSFAEVGIPGLRASPLQYVRGNLRILKMELFFDTYEIQDGDVRDETNRLVALLDNDRKTQAPPILLFSWGGLNFRCVLESASQRFTMFRDDGTPVRATLNVSFREYEPVEVEIKQGVFIGPPTIHTIVEGDTVSKIAGAVLGDPGAWKTIAAQNGIDNPRSLPAGLKLILPGPSPKAGS
jgi:hypothetical protein